jgi:hypothetical protein
VTAIDRIPERAGLRKWTTAYQISIAGKLERLFGGSLGHVIDVNQHAKPHHFLNGYNPDCGQRERILLPMLRIPG